MGGWIFGGLCLALLMGAGGYVLRLERRQRRELELLRRKLRDVEQSMELQSRRYTRLGEQLEQLHRFRHDLRHHESMLLAYVRQGDRKGLERYLGDLAPLKLDVPLRLCANGAVDALVQQYLEAARTAGVSVDAVLEVGEASGIAIPDLCVVLANCLENALEAARQLEEGTASLRLRVLETEGWLSVVQENSCPPGVLRQSGQGYLSHKAEGRVGIGLTSVRAVAEQYGGTAMYEQRAGVFRSAVILFKRDEPG